MLQLLIVIKPQAKAGFYMLAVAVGHGAQLDGILTDAAITFQELPPFLEGIGGLIAVD